MRKIKFRFWDKEAKVMNTIQGDLDPEGVLEVPPSQIIMQSTGLRDKNDVLIFEGDILQDGSVVVLVEWDNANARFYSVPGTARPWANCEVIGNLYESPKLLK